MGVCAEVCAEMISGVKAASLFVCIVVLASAAPIVEKSLYEQQAELYNSVLVQVQPATEFVEASDPVSDEPSEDLDAELKKKVIEAGDEAEAPKGWTDDAIEPEMDEATPAKTVDDHG